MTTPTLEMSRVRPGALEELCDAQGLADFPAENALIVELARAIRPARPGNQHDGLDTMGRFFEKVAFGSTECWLWCGSLSHLGYGAMNACGESKAHRVAWRLFRGDPGELFVLHECDVRNCVNPDHLFLGTQADNVHDMFRKGRNRNVGMRGEDNPASKLTSETVERMRELRRTTGLSYAKIAALFGAGTMTTYRAIVGDSWSHLAGDSEL